MPSITYNLAKITRMRIAFSLNVVIYFAAITLGLFSAVILLASPKNKLANRLLALLMLAITGWLVDAFFRTANIYGQYPTLYFLPIYYSFAFGPLLYFYVRSITNSTFRFHKTDLVHFIPVVVQAGFYWFMTFQNYQTKSDVWFNLHQPYTYRIEYDGTWLSMVGYLVISVNYLRKYRLWLKDNYSNLSKKMLTWLNISLSVLVLVCISWFFEAYLRDFRNTYYQYDLSTNLLSIGIYCIGVLGIQQAGIDLSFEPEQKLPEEIKAPPVVADTLLIAKIEKAMQQDKLYLNPELSLAELAKNLGLPAKTISATINAGFNKQFNTYVNTYRVEEVKRRFQTNDLEKLTLLGIAYESGFNSKTSFNRTFKEFTGVSPSEYIKK